MARLLKRFRREGRGAQLVEFALVLPILVVIVFGIFEFGRVFFSWNTITHAAREGARYGAVGHTEAQIEQRVREASFGDDVQVVVTYPDGNQPGKRVAVKVTYNLTIVTPIISAFFPQNPVPIANQASMRLEQ